MTNTSAISMIPALIACTSSPMPGTSTTTVTSASLRDLHFVLADADGFDEHDIVAGGIQQHASCRWSRAARPPSHAARRHGADEHARVGVMAAACGCDRPESRRRCRDWWDRPRECRPVFPSRAEAREPADRISVLLPAPGAPVMPMISRAAGVRKQLAQQ